MHKGNFGERLLCLTGQLETPLRHIILIQHISIMRQPVKLDKTDGNRVNVVLQCAYGFCNKPAITPRATGIHRTNEPVF
jgi:hypothetical protein